MNTNSELYRKEIVRLAGSINNEKILMKIYTVVLTFAKLLGGTEK